MLIPLPPLAEQKRIAAKVNQQEKVDKGRADRPKVITLVQFIREHKRLMKGQVACATLKDQVRAFDMFADHVGKDKPLVKIPPQHAESFVAKRLDDGLSVNSVNKDIRTLKGIFNLAIEPRGYLAEGTNPFARIRQRNTTQADVNYVSPEGFHKVLEAAPNLWWKSLLTLAYTSGSRRNELINLTWADVDFENRCIRIAPKKATEKLLEWEPKDHETRTIPIPEHTVPLLADMQSVADKYSPYIFLKPTRLRHILRRRAEGKWDSDTEPINNLIRDLEVIINRAKASSFTLHDLRRSCVTNWAGKLPIQTVQYLAGHSNMETTWKYYLSVQQDDLEIARELQAEIMAN